MVWSLEEIRLVEDLNLLSGLVHMIFGDLNQARVCVVPFIATPNFISQLETQFLCAIYTGFLFKIVPA